jgi:DNA-directed RNA polymerase specialized sigma24 family protein
MAAAGDEFERAARALVEGEPLFESRDLEVLERTLDSRLRRRFSTMSSADRSDVISEAVTRVLGAARAGRIDPEGNPAGYLWTAALHRALDVLQSRETVVADVPDRPAPRSDDEIAAFLDAAASSREVIGAMRLAVEAGDGECARFVSEWLVLAERLGRAPSLREAAAALRTSHSTVRRTLTRFGGYLRDLRTRAT